MAFANRVSSLWEGRGIIGARVAEVSRRRSGETLGLAEARQMQAPSDRKQAQRDDQDHAGAEGHGTRGSKRLQG